jgi:hypothetical protein
MWWPLVELTHQGRRDGGLACALVVCRPYLSNSHRFPSEAKLWDLMLCEVLFFLRFLRCQEGSLRLVHKGFSDFRKLLAIEFRYLLNFGKSHYNNYIKLKGIWYVLWPMNTTVYGARDSGRLWVWGHTWRLCFPLSWKYSAIGPWDNVGSWSSAQS